MDFGRGTTQATKDGYKIWTLKHQLCLLAYKRLNDVSIVQVMWEYNRSDGARLEPN
jgi:hypothetical protein